MHKPGKSNTPNCTTLNSSHCKLKLPVPLLLSHVEYILPLVVLRILVHLHMLIDSNHALTSACQCWVWTNVVIRKFDISSVVVPKTDSLMKWLQGFLAFHFGRPAIHIFWKSKVGWTKLRSNERHILLSNQCQLSLQLVLTPLHLEISLLIHDYSSCIPSVWEELTCLTMIWSFLVVSPSGFQVQHPLWATLKRHWEFLLI